MIAVLAHRADAAQEETARLLGARVITCADVCRPGWSVLAEEDSHPLGELSAVVVRMESVWPGELSHLRAADRAYAAAEVTAFLLAWLTGLRCPVLNPPAGNSLLGPGLRDEQWVRLAASLGVPVVPVRRGRPAQSPTATHQVVVVGERAFGEEATAAQRDWAVALAGASGAKLLSVRFASGLFLGASALVDLGAPRVQEAVLQLLRAEPVRRRAS